MNNLKKVGLNCFSWIFSCMSVPLMQLDMSVSGQAKITYVDEGEGSAGTNRRNW
jgi:hypothetical protein